MSRTTYCTIPPINPFLDFKSNVTRKGLRISYPVLDKIYPDLDKFTVHHLNDEHRLNELFEEVVEMPENERSGYLDKMCSNESELRAKIEELLKGVDKTPPDDFLDPTSVSRVFQRFLDLERSAE